MSKVPALSLEIGKSDFVFKLISWHSIIIFNCDKNQRNTLRKHAHMIYSNFFRSKIDNFQMNIFYSFLIFAQNIDCGYTLEPPC